MSRAPSTLPFPLEPSPSPEQIMMRQPSQHYANMQPQPQYANMQPQPQYANMPPQPQYPSSPPPKYPSLQPPLPPQLKQRTQQNNRYISNLCRAGPLPQSRHSITDPICSIVYILFLIATIVLYCINYFSTSLRSDIRFGDLSFFQKLSYTMQQTLPETMFTCACLFVVGVVLMFLLIILYQVVGYLIILLCLALFGFIIYTLVALQWGDIVISSSVKNQQNYQTQSNIFRICLIVVCSISAAFILYLIIRRFKKLKHLSAMMGVVKVIILGNMPYLPIMLLVVLNGIDMGIWCAFCYTFWNTTRFTLSQTPLPISPTLILIFVIILWLWTHGILLSVSDYLAESWVLHWYYKQKTEDPSSQLRDTALKQNWRRLVIKKLFRYHFGTCVYGSFFSAYTSQTLIKLIRKFVQKRQTNVQQNGQPSNPSLLRNIGYLSRYSYIQTVMQALNYCQSNRQMFLLRKRIKQKIPQIYMLGHFLEQIMKLTLSISALYLWFIFTYKMSSFLDKNVIDFTPVLFLVFCFVTTLGIFLEVSTNISHIFGIVSDTAVIAYAIDCEVERVHYDSNGPQSVPEKLREMFTKLHVDMELRNKGAYKNNNSVFQDNQYGNQNAYIGVSGIQH